jgi:hypothetical protein
LASLAQNLDIVGHKRNFSNSNIKKWNRHLIRCKTDYLVISNLIWGSKKITSGSFVTKFSAMIRMANDEMKDWDPGL